MKVMIYVTKSQLKMFYDRTCKKFKTSLKPPYDAKILNGFIVGYFDLNHVNKYEFDNGIDYNVVKTLYGALNNRKVSLEDGSHLTYSQIEHYLFKDCEFGQKIFYGWIIENLVVEKTLFRLSSVAPQDWRYSGHFGDEESILLSVQPQWACMILNGEKTIEVRKTCPKGFKYGK